MIGLILVLIPFIICFLTAKFIIKDDQYVRKIFVSMMFISLFSLIAQLGEKLWKYAVS